MNDSGLSQAEQHSLRKLDTPINIVGRSCRLPGANSVEEFWQLLSTGRCSITQMQPERFSMSAFSNPRRGEKGKAYTFAAGVIDDVWGFDPAVFSISPREAAQMDPQQRLLLMLVWEALEDAGIPISSVSGRQVGVYVGNSMVDYNHRFLFDPAGGDSFMMTGNSMSLISNRVSYIFDLHGPSETIDTACSSSSLAVDHAITALKLGQIDMAIVAGVNLMMSPFPFIGFSAASMLSPQGLCRAFDKDAFGYVRSEGGVVFILQRADAAEQPYRCYAQLVASGSNSDGRTMGVALPSEVYQAELLSRVYQQAGIDPNDLAFVEAHGTGTRVGDPAETTALGRVIGQHRSKPLPIGSVKTNVGHLEPASGMVGLLKAVLSLEHNAFPASLHFDTPNPDIPFDQLNLKVNTQLTQLDRGPGLRYAGVNSFGFGGTNVHTIMTDPPVVAELSAHQGAHPLPGIMLLSAHCESALRELAGQYAFSIERMDDEDQVARLINAIAYRRDLMPERLVITGSSAADYAQALRAYAEGQKPDNVATARVEERSIKIALAFSGNGSQWAGMGVQALERNRSFADSFDAIDQQFMTMADWSLRAMLLADDLEQQLDNTQVAQLLLFAIQVALADSLKSMGLQFDAVLGHSAGEVAAAYSCGAIDLEQAVTIMLARSRHQEVLKGQGSMVAVSMAAEEISELLTNQRLKGIEISAINTPHSLTLTGSSIAIEAFCQYARKNRIAYKSLGVDYPFHSASLDPVEELLISDLQGLNPQPAHRAFYSSVTGNRIEGQDLDSRYWWRNVRDPVLFSDAVKAASDDGYGLFIELGPRPVLNGYLNKIARDSDRSFAALKSLDQSDSGALDPVVSVFASALARGAGFDKTRVFGDDWRADLVLPSYPWQKTNYVPPLSSEAMEAIKLSVPPHPLLGRQVRAGDLVWTVDLDTNLLPFLNDHKVDGRVILPGAAFAEMSISAGAIWLGTDLIEMSNLDILHPLTLSEDYTVQVKTRISVETGTVEISSRKRLSDNEWQLHSRCRVSRIPGDISPEAIAPSAHPAADPSEVRRLYHTSRQMGLEFGPLFRRMARCEEPEQDIIEVVLDRRNPVLDPNDGESSAYLLHPLDLDACFHGLSLVYDKLDLGSDRLPFIPVRIGRLRLYKPTAEVRTARLRIRRATRRGGCGDFELFDANGDLVSVLQDARFRATALTRRHSIQASSFSFDAVHLPIMAQSDDALSLPDSLFDDGFDTPLAQDSAGEEQRLMLDLAARRAVYDLLDLLADEQRRIDLPTLRRTWAGRLASFTNPMDREQQAELLDHIESIVSAFLRVTAQSEQVQQQDHGWTLDATCPIPSLAELVQTVLDEEPRWVADCALLTHAFHRLKSVFRGDLPLQTLLEDSNSVYSSALLDQRHTASPSALMMIDRLSAAIDKIVDQWPPGKPLRVLELGCGYGGLTRRLVPTIARRKGQLLSADRSSLQVSRLLIEFQTSPNFNALAVEDQTDFADLGLFDLVVSLNGISQLDREPERLLQEVSQVLVPGGLMLCMVAPAGVYDDLVFAPCPRASGDAATGPLSSQFSISANDWMDKLQASGLPVLASPALTEVSDDVLLIVSGKNTPVTIEQAMPATSPDRSKVMLVEASADQNDDFRIKLFDELAHLGFADLEHLPNDDPANWQPLETALASAATTGQMTELLFVSNPANNEDKPSEELSQRITRLTSMLQAIEDARCRLWIIAPGGARGELDAAQARPGQSAIWAFGRTVMNEYAHLDTRMVDFNPALSPTQGAQRMAKLLAAPGQQSEIILQAEGILSLRLKRGPNIDSMPELPDNRRITLNHPVSGSLDDLSWVAVPQPTLEPDEVRIAVKAAGLNFRDVMWAQGLLPEEALEDGFAGATLGIECSGHIAEIGQQVSGYKVGDPVIALAPASFSSHVTVKQAAVAHCPANLDLTAAATVPVTFLTAYYALHQLAQLQKGQWVLIHGAAGGVGLAALQIARDKSARIIATAGSDEKRQLLELLGADHVLNTRSLDFVDQVTQITRQHGVEGVDVVLNSLSGEAMERSLELLRPFGKFLELGKRDYFANTKIGLRPLRQNISYFGIDADQLLKYQPDQAQQLLSEVMQAFDDNRFTPLPYRLFASQDVQAAFRLMQQSGHVGKVLLSAPTPGNVSADCSRHRFEASAEGAHVIFGGLGGFGLEAARYLSDHGATSIVLTSRSAKPSDQVTQLLEELEANGTRVMLRRCDVTDTQSVAELLQEIRAQQPIKGVIHSAMVLEDRLVRNLTREAIEKVLKPKVQGSEILDQLTRQDGLDYFLLFSSSAVLFGNPGQANYVAANAYMDAVAQRRKAAGLPALSVQWGAITDVGILARKQATTKSLSRHAGGIEFKARQGLELMGQLLANHRQLGHPAAVALAATDWSLVGDSLPIMRSPTLELMAREASMGTQTTETLDLQSLIEGLSDNQARERIAELIAQEAAHIFRMPVQQIKRQHSLVELGMDSLMAIELIVASEQKLGIEVPTSSIGQGTTINDLAMEVLHRIRRNNEVEQEPSVLNQSIARQHLAEDINPEQLNAIASKVADQGS